MRTKGALGAMMFRPISEQTEEYREQETALTERLMDLARKSPLNLPATSPSVSRQKVQRCRTPKPPAKTATPKPD